MDILDTLPLDDAPFNEHQKQTMNQYLGPPPAAMMAHSGKGATTIGATGESIEDTKWKIIGYVVIAVLLVINPWTQSMLKNVPYAGDSNVVLMAVTMAILIVLLIIVMYCLV